ncbi:BEM_HP_G0118580.mRNA.1.CDS.1 [Saccharomyces cerevisiae]|nr:BEM_HP_G0118580.mRNA.1.CDS.1 [Saccharomyces cerevisiae]CAI6402825.1 BEM_HP_G0118580.mRNA.1.CDS.1 [Saccharomyces cerevisiae]
MIRLFDLNYTQTLDLIEKISKAGGCGINFDWCKSINFDGSSWNPAADQQALARVWRRSKNCFIYRFLSTGTMRKKSFKDNL